MVSQWTNQLAGKDADAVSTRLNASRIYFPFKAKSNLHRTSFGRARDTKGCRFFIVKMDFSCQLRHTRPQNVNGLSNGQCKSTSHAYKVCTDVRERKNYHNSRASEKTTVFPWPFLWSTIIIMNYVELIRISNQSYRIAQSQRPSYWKKMQSAVHINFMHRFVHLHTTQAHTAHTHTHPYNVVVVTAILHCVSACAGNVLQSGLINMLAHPLSTYYTVLRYELWVCEPMRCNKQICNYNTIRWINKWNLHM